MIPNGSPATFDGVLTLVATVWRFEGPSTRDARRTVFPRSFYCIVLATLQNTLFAFPPTKRIVPMTRTRITAACSPFDLYGLLPVFPSLGRIVLFRHCPLRTPNAMSVLLGSGGRIDRFPTPPFSSRDSEHCFGLSHEPALMAFQTSYSGAFVFPVYRSLKRAKGRCCRR